MDVSVKAGATNVSHWARAPGAASATTMNERSARKTPAGEKGAARIGVSCGSVPTNVGRPAIHARFGAAVPMKNSKDVAISTAAPPGCSAGLADRSAASLGDGDAEL